MVENKVSDKLKYPLTYDILIKTILYKNQDLIVDLIKELIDIRIENIEVDIKNNEIYIDKITEKERKVDLQIKINKDTIVNFEFNTGYYKDVKDRNLVYATKIRNANIKKGMTDKRINDIKVIQINFCGKSTKQDKMEDIGYYKLENNNQIKIDNPLILIKNLDKFKEAYYNGDRRKKTVLLAFFKSETMEEAEKILKEAIGEERSKKIIMEVKEIMIKDYYTLRMTTEDWFRSEGISIGYDKGLKQGIKDGEKKEQKTLIENMFKNKLDINLISKITGKSVKQLQKIKSNL